ncbi:hypothetical protein L0128_04085 [candidate division KSB1 bacterium]|nr:hypothetical protein [candidate division KSB1 bacterium]
MCAIIDTNLIAEVLSRPTPPDFCPILEWLVSPKSDGKFVLGGMLAEELLGDEKTHPGVHAVRRFIKALHQAGRVRIIPKRIVDYETNKVRELCVSNDSHVIALARISGARILCSHDHTLHKDFTNARLIDHPRGHIYQTRDHAHLLKRYGHTRACRRSMNQ